MIKYEKLMRIRTQIHDNETEDADDMTFINLREY